MRKILLFSLANLLFFTYSFSQNQLKQGDYFITNYSPFTYNASEQNWAVVSDDRGVMYFGNNDDGIIEYDGVNWNLIKVEKNPVIRTLAKNPKGVIYVGAEKEFGYLMPNKSGELIYKSLSNNLDSTAANFNQILKVYFEGDTTYFCSSSKIFLYENEILKEIIDLPPDSYYSFLINKKLYVHNFAKGLCLLNEGELNVLKGGGLFVDKGVMSINLFEKDRVLVGTLDNGVYIYNLLTGEIENEKLKNEANEYLTLSGIYNCKQISENEFLFSTLDKGSVIMTKKGEITSVFNEKNGLLNDISTSAYGGYSQPTWLALQLGLSKIETNSPIRKMGKKYGLKGIVSDILTVNDILYVSTLSKSYYFEKESNRFKEIENVGIESWDLQEVENKNGTNTLLLANSAGLFEIINKKANLKLEGQFKKILPSNRIKNHFFILSSNGIELVIKDENNFEITKIELNLSEKIETISLDNLDNLWLTSISGKVYFYKNIGGEYKQEKINENNLLAESNPFSDEKLNKIFIPTKKGIFSYNAEENEFEKCTLFTERYFSKEFYVRSILKDKKENYWFICKNNKQEWVEKLKFEKDKVVIDSITFKRLKSKQLDVVYSSGSHTWIGYSGGLFRYDESIKTENKANFHCLIRDIRLNEDSIIYKGTAYEYDSDLERNLVRLSPNDELGYQFNYSHNAIAFSFASPFFEEEENTEYSWRLVGYENKFTKWSEKVTINYTNLYEGKYVFEVKSRNIYGFETEVTSLKFNILPPWYRTLLAYFTYFILTILMVILIVRLNSRRLIAQKEQLEKIVTQRTEEVLEQKKVLEIKNKEITASINYAEKIQKAIFPPDNFLKEHFEYFIFFKPRDIVSGDFYWLQQLGNKIVVVAADCTGHGVPGAFMSMLGVSSLNEIVRKSNIPNSNKILDKLRDKIKDSLHHDETEKTDGMDLALYILDLDNLKIQFSGAYNPLIIIRENELIQLKGDRQPIGSYLKEKPFSMQEFQLQKNDILYTFSDGFPDQLGGEEEKKYMIKNFKKFLIQINNETLEKQHELLATELKNWMGQEEQLDDILIIGLKIV